MTFNVVLGEDTYRVTINVVKKNTLRKKIGFLFFYCFTYKINIDIG